jgi:uncharacterized membrane protein
MRRMASQILIEVLGYGHVLSAIGWLGGGILTTFVLGPGVRNLSQGAALEFNAKVLPRILSFVQAAIGSTLVFGLLLLYFVSDSLTTTQSYEIYAGAGIALVTAAVVWTITVPSFKKVVKISDSVLKGERPAPPPEMMKYGKRARLSSLVGVSLLLISLSMMIASGFS